MATRRSIIISCALTGGASGTRERNPAVPVSPQEIAEQAIDAARAGAAIVHIHVRDPATGEPSSKFEYYQETVSRIREAGSGVLINLTTGPGCILNIPTDEPYRVEPIAHSQLMTPAQRIEHILKLKPDICSLDVATMNVGDAVFANPVPHLKLMAEGIRKSGVIMELEVFDLGHVRLAQHLMQSGALPRNCYFQFCLAVPWGAPATPEVLASMRNMLPDETTWSAFGIGPDQFPMVAVSAVMGGHVRVGLEDNLYVAHRQLAKSNAELVSKAARIVRDLGFEVAAASEARETLLPISNA